MINNQTNSLNNEAFLPKVSVVVPVYNGEADIPDLINCLCVQTYPRDRVEYLLVDNASRDRTAEIIKAACEDAKQQGLTIHYLSEHKIQSSYAARNVGIRASSGEIIAFTDADCRPQPDWLYALVQPFAELTVGFVGGAIVPLSNKTLFEKYAERRKILCHKQTALHPFLPYAAGANLAIRRQTLQEVGLFRPYLTTGGDADICWRIQKQSNWGFYLSDDAVVYHRHRSSLQELQKQFLRYGYSQHFLSELYNSEPNSSNLIKYPLDSPYRLLGWLKDMPKLLVKLAIRRATLVDLMETPIDILVSQATANGRRKAMLTNEARKIEWLS
jgi:cellulose synthase/poly-beta-1,6-N-acetylglucosamine synthase-like glycosyltransferase